MRNITNYQLKAHNITVVKEVYPYTFGEHIFVFQVHAMQSHINCHSRGVTFFSMYCHCSMKTMSTITPKIQCQAMVKFCNNLWKEHKKIRQCILASLLKFANIYITLRNIENAKTNYHGICDHQSDQCCPNL